MLISSDPGRPSPQIVRFDAFELDEAEARLLREGQRVTLAPKPFAVLCALVRKPGELVSKEALLDSVWGHRFVSDSVLKTAISELRTALADEARRPRYIETVSRRGYRFMGVTSAVPAIQSLRATALPRGPKATPLIGRSEALARLRAAWNLACTGKRTLVWIAGDPGIGKTALIDHFVSTLSGVATARGQCVAQYGSGEPYLPILEALAELSHREGTVLQLLRAVAPTWLVQLPWLSTPEERVALRRELAGVRQDRMLREMGELLDRYTEHRPLLLVTEDLHWCDDATVQLLNYVARRRGNARLMWLASFRIADIIAFDHPLKTLRNELSLHGLCDEIVLDPFSEEEVAQYVAQTAPSLATDETFVRILHERTDGLPLFVTHVMTDLIACGKAVVGEARTALVTRRMATPESLAGVIDQYIARLTDERRAVLEVAAICGVQFRIQTIATVLERDAASVAPICDELARAHLWLIAPAEGRDVAPDSPYSFRHALFRQWLYERIGPVARMQLHRKVGAALERERDSGGPVTAAELASHFERGGEHMPALRHYAEAAESALLHFGPKEAMDLTQRGLALLDRAEGSEVRDALEIALATLRGVSAVHLLGVASTEAKAAFCRAYVLLPRVPRHPMRRLLTHELGYVMCLRGEYSEALALAERMSELSQVAQDPALMMGACLVQAQVHFIRGRPRLAREWAERGLTLCEPVGESTSNAADSLADARVTLLGVLGIQLLHLGRVEEGRARLQEARRLARQAGQAMQQCVAIWDEALFEVRLGNYARVAELARELLALDDSAFAQGRAGGRIFAGWAQARMTDPRGGYCTIRDAYEENRRLGMRVGASETLGYAAEAAVLAGDWDAARQQLDEALEIVHTLGERVYLPQLWLIEAAIEDARGDVAAARKCIRRAVDEAREQEARWLELMALLALCERGDATAEDRRALAAVVEQLTDAGDTAAVRRARALLEGTDPCERGRRARAPARRVRHISTGQGSPGEQA